MIAEETQGGPRHTWSFFRAGGVDQVVLRDGADLASLAQLDQKLWVALTLPASGVEFDPRTLALLDTDGDGRIRPPEILAAVAWAKGAFKDLGGLVKGGDSVSLAAIQDPELLAGATRILVNLGRPDATAITLDDVSSQERIFAGTTLNGDGIVPADAADDEATRAAIRDILATVGALTDRSGRPGVDQVNLDAFFDQAGAYVAWAGQAVADSAFLPLGPDGTGPAVAAVQAVKTKIDDYFARCRLAAFDPRAQAAMNREESEYLALSAKDLTIASGEIAVFPIARVAGGRPLPLDGGVNPAWAAAVAALSVQVVAPLLGEGRTSLTEDEWAAIQETLAPFSVWTAAKPVTVVEPLGEARLRELVGSPARARIAELIARDAALAGENARIEAVGKLVLFQRDLFRLLTNTVSFASFYGRKGAAFQAGTLYLDARECSLCIEVADAAKHAALAGQSGAFLAYCDLSRAGGARKSIVAVVTDGDSETLTVGRNGVFYDRSGLDWDATIAKVVSNPISVREAFWMPYRKLIRFVEEQIAKRAQAADAASTAKMSGVAAAAVAPAPPVAVPPKKIDLGTIALIGTAIGGISALVGGFLQALFGLGIWLPLGVLGVILLISGPSMAIAALKLRLRNLGPILDANGWAVNIRARLNIPFGATMTRLARLPQGAGRSAADPFEEKRRPWKLWLVLAVLAALGYAWWIGRLDSYLPEAARRVPAAVPQVPAPPAP
ncbi:MAG: hypothetical protein KJ579_08985 [Verrucomicrobia bacterium]|nr:hypothetical protein [Verrucomicrobiota bacterium]